MVKGVNTSVGTDSSRRSKKNRRRKSNPTKSGIETDPMTGDSTMAHTDSSDLKRRSRRRRRRKNKMSFVPMPPEPTVPNWFTNMSLDDPDRLPMANYLLTYYEEMGESRQEEDHNRAMCKAIASYYSSIINPDI